MNYSQIISQEHKALFIIAIDQSGSMQSPFHRHTITAKKCEIASSVASALIDELVMHSQQAHRLNDPCPYCDIAVLGYSQNEVYPLLHPGAVVLPITALNRDATPHYTRAAVYINSQNHPEFVLESIKEWVKPRTGGSTPITDTVNIISDIVNEWCSNSANQDSFPPIIFNITDSIDESEYTGSLIERLELLKNIGTNDGRTLVFNICIDANPIEDRFYFPRLEDIPEAHPIYALARSSSTIPERFVPWAKIFNPEATTECRALCYNSAILQLIPLLNISVNW